MTEEQSKELQRLKEIARSARDDAKGAEGDYDAAAATVEDAWDLTYAAWGAVSAYKSKFKELNDG